jgi:hypothetical protein
MMWTRTRRFLAILGAVSWIPCASPAQSVPELKLTRDLRIDAAEHELSPITYMGVAPNGSIAIQQNQDGTVRFFDARAASMGAFGRKGQGPGEFTNAGRLAWIGDTLIVSDIGTRRFTLISADRKLVKTVPWAQSVAPPGGTAPGVAPQRVSQARFPHADGSQLVVSTFSEETPVPPWLGGGKPGTLYLRIDANGALDHVLGWMPSTSGCSVAISTNGGFELSRIPFCPLPIDDVAPDGNRVVLTYVERTDAYRVVAVRSNGQTIFDRTISYRPQPIPRHVRDSITAAALRSPMPSRRATADRIPESYPPLSRILVGRDATTWLEVFSASGDRTWHVLDAQGNVAGRITIPRNIDIKVASRDIVWATETDDDGLQHIVRFRVSR